MPLKAAVLLFLLQLFPLFMSSNHPHHFLKKYLSIWLCQVFSCWMWDPVPWPGIEPGPPALGARSLNHWTTGKSPILTLRSQFKCFFWENTSFHEWLLAYRERGCFPTLWWCAHQTLSTGSLIILYCNYYWYSHLPLENLFILATQSTANLSLVLMDLQVSESNI